MRIFLLDMQGITAAPVQALARTLPAVRRQEAERCRRKGYFEQSVLGFCLVRYAVRQIEPLADAETWTYGAHGKPHLTQGHPFFNLSHTAHGVAVAVSAKSEVGIDIEAVLPRRESLLRRVCSDNEIKEILTSENPSSTFTRLWSVKEAVLKQNGIGIANLDEMRHIPLNGVKSTQLSLGNVPHWLSVAPTETLPALQWVTLTQLT